MERQYNIVGRLKALTWLLLATGAPYDKRVAKKFLTAKSKLIRITDQLNETIKTQKQKRAPIGGKTWQKCEKEVAE